jgi:hypothetical protein
MKIPRKVKIAGQTYAVKSDRAVGDFGYLGRISFQTLEIQIDGSVVTERQEQTFLHEILEAINKEYDVDLTHHQIEQLEGALYQVVKDNPTIFQRS